MSNTSSTTVMEIRTTGYGHPDAAKLAAEVQQEYVRRYGDVDQTTMHEDHFDPPHGLFVVGYLDGEPVACGGWRVKEARLPALPATRDERSPILAPAEVELR